VDLSSVFLIYPNTEKVISALNNYFFDRIDS